MAAAVKRGRLRGIPYIIETTSFAHADKVPQHEDADQLVKLLPKPREPVVFRVVTPNFRGYERAIEADEARGPNNQVIGRIAALISTNNGFNEHNLGMTIDRSLIEIINIQTEVDRKNFDNKQSGGIQRELDVYISDIASLWTPSGIRTSPNPEAINNLLNVVNRLYREAGVRNFILGATTGHETPEMIRAAFSAIWEMAERENYEDKISIGIHAHDTEGNGLANTIEAVKYGATSVEGSSAGAGLQSHESDDIIGVNISNLPQALRRRGNTSTTRIVRALERLGIETSVRPRKANKAGRLARQRMRKAARTRK